MPWYIICADVQMRKLGSAACISWNTFLPVVVR